MALARVQGGESDGRPRRRRCTGSVPAFELASGRARDGASSSASRSCSPMSTASCAASRTASSRRSTTACAAPDHRRRAPFGWRAGLGAPAMKLGFLTACLPGVPLERIADWAAAHDFQALEVAVWPDVPGRPFEASHIDVASLDAGRSGARSAPISATRASRSRRLPTTRTTCTPTSRCAKGSGPICAAASTPPRCSAVSSSGTFVGRDWNLHGERERQARQRDTAAARRVRR